MAIELQQVTHCFGERQVLAQITLTLTERRIAIIGSNGSGKSSFARLINGLIIPDRGHVIIDGQNTRHHAKAIRRKVGFVFQNPDHQIVLPLVEEDIAFGLKNLKLSPAEIKSRVDDVLERYGLTAMRQQPAHLLSGGEKQLLALASVLVMQPDYVVFDEPTTLLDLRNKRRIRKIIRELPQTVLLVSHELDALTDFERVLVLEDGRVVMDDCPTRAIAYYRHSMDD